MNSRERSNSNLKPFKPGQSGNPKGRPRKTPISDAYEQVAMSLAKDMGIKEGDTVALAVVKVVFREALKGNIQAAAQATDRIEGKPTTRVELSGPDGAALAHEVNISSDDLIRELYRIYGCVQDPNTPARHRKPIKDVPLPE